MVPPIHDLEVVPGCSEQEMEDGLKIQRSEAGHFFQDWNLAPHPGVWRPEMFLIQDERLWRVVVGARLPSCQLSTITWPNQGILICKRRTYANILESERCKRKYQTLVIFLTIYVQHMTVM